jgi:hypothetical protein
MPGYDAPLRGRRVDLVKAATARTSVRVEENDAGGKTSKQQEAKHRDLPGRSLPMRRGCHARSLHLRRIARPEAFFFNVRA